MRVAIGGRLPAWLGNVWRLLEEQPPRFSVAPSDRRHAHRLWDDIDDPPPASDEGRIGAVATNVPRVAVILRDVVARLSRAIVPDSGLELRGAVYYPAGGGVGWHTNSDAPGWRLYVVRASGASFLRTASGTYMDVNGTVNLFEVTGRSSWHCIGALDERWVVGFRVSPDVARRFLP